MKWDIHTELEGIGSNLLAYLRKLGISLKAEGGNLYPSGSTGNLSDDMRDLIRSHKAELLAKLTPKEKPLTTKERNTLLLVINALAEEGVKLDLSKTSKSAEVIAQLTQKAGNPVSARAIEKILKQIPEAKERRG
jgi:hypothetical protein